MNVHHIDNGVNSKFHHDYQPITYWFIGWVDWIRWGKNDYKYESILVEIRRRKFSLN